MPSISNLTQEIAYAITPQNAGAINAITSGTVPEQVSYSIQQVISQGTNQVNNKLEEEVYSKVGELIGPYVAGVTSANIPDFLKNTSIFSSLGIDGSINGIVTNTAANIELAYRNAVSSSLSSIFGGSASGGTTGILNTISQVNITNSFNDKLSGAANISVPKQVSTKTLEILTDASLNQTQRAQQAAEYFQNATGTSISGSQLSALLNSIDTTLAGIIRYGEESLPTPLPYEIGNDNIVPGVNYVSSVEELEAELSAISRDISEVIVHWTETFTNANLSAQQVEELCDGKKYHYVIRRDGSLQRSLPVDVVGNHADTLGHNQYSIGVVFVGGINAPTNSETVDTFISSASLTRSQMNTFYHFLRAFFNYYPGGQVLGHRDFDISKNDPGFDTRDYVYSSFNKYSMYVDTLREPAKSPSSIVSTQLNTITSAILDKNPDMMVSTS